MRERDQLTEEAAWALFAATGLPEAYLLSRWAAPQDPKSEKRKTVHHPMTRPH